MYFLEILHGSDKLLDACFLSSTIKFCEINSSNMEFFHEHCLKLVKFDYRNCNSILQDLYNLWQIFHSHFTIYVY